jgi:hypothetical protein
VHAWIGVGSSKVANAERRSTGMSSCANEMIGVILSESAVWMAMACFDKKSTTAAGEGSVAGFSTTSESFLRFFFCFASVS